MTIIMAFDVDLVQHQLIGADNISHLKLLFKTMHAVSKTSIISISQITYMYVVFNFAGKIK